MGNTCKSVVEEFPDGLVLAAVDRAQRHRQGEPGGPVITGDIYRHLDVRRSSGAGRRLRKRILAIEEAGLLQQQRRRGAQVWRLTPAGRRRIHRARRAGEMGELPESPQHAWWRHARSTAAEEIERTRRELRDHAEELLRLLDSNQLVSSDVWFGLGAGLGRSAWVVGSMTHCLYEWREPNDAQADSDEYTSPGDGAFTEHECVAMRTRRHGRRNPYLWREQ